MTPSARVAAAIEILDEIAEGQPAERALTRWARAHRFAGSKDRAAIRDHVYDVLRHWRSDAARGGDDTGRARMIGRLRGMGVDPTTLFHGEGYAPAPLSDAELQPPQLDDLDRGVLWDLPDWIVPLFDESLGADAAATARTLTERAPVTLRVNAARATRGAMQASLADEGIVTRVNARADTALTITEGARRLRNSAAYRDGLVEIQDASSQASVAGLGTPGRALDLCAGGGGKSLALAALGWSVTASDIDMSRTRDLPERSARGGHNILLYGANEVSAQGPFDLVFVDAPCSGSGTWRRTPDAKWALTSELFEDLLNMQRTVLKTAAALTRPGGTLVYATCSILAPENAQQIQEFAHRYPEFRVQDTTQWPVDADGDGFFRAVLTRMA